MVPKPWEDDDAEYWSRFYCVEHEDLFDVEVELLEYHHNTMRARITGRTCDANYYDGSDPMMRIEVEALFAFVRGRARR
jgi:hypothetical protein